MLQFKCVVRLVSYLTDIFCLQVAVMSLVNQGFLFSYDFMLLVVIHSLTQNEKNDVITLVYQLRLSQMSLIIFKDNIWTISRKCCVQTAPGLARDARALLACVVALKADISQSAYLDLCNE